MLQSDAVLEQASGRMSFLTDHKLDCSTPASSLGVDDNVAQAFRSAAHAFHVQAAALFRSGRLVAFASPEGALTMEQVAPAVATSTDVATRGPVTRFYTPPGSESDFVLYATPVRGDLALAAFFTMDTPLGNAVDRARLVQAILRASAVGRKASRRRTRRSRRLRCRATGFRRSHPKDWSRSCCRDLPRPPRRPPRPPSPWPCHVIGFPRRRQTRTASPSSSRLPRRLSCRLSARSSSRQRRRPPTRRCLLARPRSAPGTPPDGDWSSRCAPGSIARASP
jgi:hypothetical protein